jgi:hypothetical protein
MEFLFVRVAPQYLNSSTLSKDLLSTFYVVIVSCVLISRHDHVPSFLSIYF